MSWLVLAASSPHFIRLLTKQDPHTSTHFLLQSETHACMHACAWLRGAQTVEFSQTNERTQEEIEEETSWGKNCYTDLTDRLSRLSLIWPISAVWIVLWMKVRIEWVSGGRSSSPTAADLAGTVREKRKKEEKGRETNEVVHNNPVYDVNCEWCWRTKKKLWETKTEKRQKRTNLEKVFFKFERKRFLA